MKHLLKTSEEWQKECTTIIIDPDGWDRKNFDFSWKVEEITKAEFEKRMVISTCHFAKPIIDKNGIFTVSRR